MFWLLSWAVWIFGALPLLVVCLIVLMRLKKTENESLQKSDWKKDVVYLYQFHLVPKVRTMSPFALKVETWLRMNKIKYETFETMKFSKKGQIPFIELNGEQIADSNIIIKSLKKHFSTDPDAEYSTEAQSVAHAVTSMMENHTAITGIHYRYGHHMKKLLEYLHVSEFYPGNTATLMGFFLPYQTRLRCYLHGIGRHEFEEVWEFARQDLLSISAVLGDKPFLLGDKPSTIDCTLFGHLIQFLYIDIGFPQRDVLVTECQNLVDLVERMKETFWPDWEQQMPKIKQKSD